MRIGIAARGLSEKSGGAKQYIESLIHGLLKIDKGNQYVIYLNTEELRGAFPQGTERVLPSRNRLYWDFRLLPPALRKDDIDVILFPKNVLPYGIDCKSVIVNLDFGYFIKELKEYKFFDQLYMRAMIPTSAKRADAILAISEYTKKDTVRFTGVSPDKVTVTHLAADPKYRPIEDRERLERARGKYGLDFPFIFHCGSLSPRKNIARLLRSLHNLKERLPHRLVFSAGKSWNDKQIDLLIQELGLGERIVKLGHIENEDMPLLYNLADLYIYPSIFEGFGLPVLEAMACGCPVVTSDATSLPEVAGDAALIVNPYDERAIATGIQAVLKDNRLKEELIRKGFSQAQKFNWEKTARQTLAVFESLAG